MSFLHLEAGDEIVSGEELVEDEFERVVAARLIQSEHVKRPPINVL